MMSLATFSPLTNKYTPLYLSPLYIYIIHFCSLLESSHWDPEKGKIYMYVHTSGTSLCLKKPTRKSVFFTLYKRGVSRGWSPFNEYWGSVVTFICKRYLADEEKKQGKGSWPLSNNVYKKYVFGGLNHIILQPYICFELSLVKIIHFYRNNYM